MLPSSPCTDILSIAHTYQNVGWSSSDLWMFMGIPKAVPIFLQLCVSELTYS